MTGLRDLEARNEALVSAGPLAVFDAAYDVNIAARRAEQNQEFRQAIALWMQSEAQFGPTRLTRVGLGACLSEAGDLAAAETVFAQAQRDYPQDTEIAAHYALLPARQEDWLKSALRWHAVLERFPDLTAYHGVVAVTFARAGIHDIAERILDEALVREPGSVELRADHAIIAQYAERWGDAVARWDRVLQLSPDDPVLRNFRGAAVMHATMEAPPSAAPKPAAGGEAAEGMPELGEIVTRFESLGDNCEFGLLQRRFGVEPMGLFRFSAVEPLRMVELLDQDLIPLGEPAHTQITEESGEYVVYDDRGYFRMHSFVLKGQMDEARYLKQQSARMTLLKRKLLLDLRAGSKIFVCKDTNFPISNAVLGLLWASLNRYGPNMLLGMRLADAEHPSGSVIELVPGIWVGHVDRMFGNGTEIDVEGWTRVLRQVYRRRFG